MWYRAVVLNKWVEILQAWPVLVVAVVREQIGDSGGDGWQDQSKADTWLFWQLAVWLCEADSVSCTE